MDWVAGVFGLGGALIGAAASLVGVWLTNRNSAKQKTAEFERDTRDKYAGEIRSIFLNVQREAHNMDEEHDRRSKTDNEGIRVYIFPDTGYEMMTRPYWKALEELSDQANLIGNDNFNAALRTYIDVRYAKIWTISRNGKEWEELPTEEEALKDLLVATRESMNIIMHA